MSETGANVGESNRVNFYPIGAATMNLRSLGSEYHDRRLQRPPLPRAVFSQHRAVQQHLVDPNAAVGSVETLKAGGGATYGADAVAGVVNYVTRKDFEGLELNGDYRYIEDSDGDYSVDGLWGSEPRRCRRVMVSLSYQHRSALNEIDRDWTQLHLSGESEQLAVPDVRRLEPRQLRRIPASGGRRADIVHTHTDAGKLLQMGAGGSMRDVGCTEPRRLRGWTNTPKPGVLHEYSGDGRAGHGAGQLQSRTSSTTWKPGGLRFHTEALAYQPGHSRNRARPARS